MLLAGQLTTHTTRQPEPPTYCITGEDYYHVG